jgi:hypothetical protein
MRYAALGFLAALVAVGCGGPSIKKQEYAQLSNSKEFEEEFPVVWKGVITALGDYKIEDKDQEKGRVRTDWIYSTSNDKYLEFQVNGFPRKRYLQTRYKFDVEIKKQIGSVKVIVNPQEEIENLRSDGSFDNWKAVSDYDTGRANELVKNIELKILSRPDALDK